MVVVTSEGVVASSPGYGFAVVEDARWAAD